ncbi:MAG TPA: hypothetical protein VGH33_06590, partial [Isosphaeraceae bacterium]
HRYEMAIDRSLRATIQLLIVLERSGADLAGAEAEVAAAEPDDSPQLPTPQDNVTSIVTEPRSASAGAEPPASGSLGAGEPGPIPRPEPAPNRPRNMPARAVAGAGGGGSTA